MTLALVLMQAVWSLINPCDVAAAAEQLHNPQVSYNPEYQTIEFPNGDIAEGQGVCTDVLVRAFRHLGVDLQVEIHRIMSEPKDPNIDHRRVPNIAKYLDESVHWKVTSEPPQPGDVIWWKLPGNNLNHIGIVTSNGMVMHNIGRGQVADVRPDDYPRHRVYRLVHASHD